MPAGSRRGRGVAAAAAALAAFSLWLFWPGIVLYDAVGQYEQALTGVYDDWHPPIMARIWSLLLQLWPGSAPMLVLQLGLFWGGLGLLALACARRGNALAGWAILAAGVGILLNCWMGAVLKDAQMVGALAAATGIIGRHRLQDRRVPGWALALAAMLLLYALLLRANAVFAVVPLALALTGWLGLRSLAARAAFVGASVVLVILLSPPVNHRLLGAEPSGVENSLLIYDLAGTGVRARAGDVAGVPASRWAEIAAAGCYRAWQWDPLGEDPCIPAPGLIALPENKPLYGPWLAAIFHHPVAYGLHRLAHFNATMRLFVPRNVPGALGPVYPEANRFGLGASPGAALLAFEQAGQWWTSLPLSWPCFWLALASVSLWPAMAAEDGPENFMTLALLLSACGGGFSFLLVSLASDLRYHLWTMLASAIGIALLGDSGAIRRRHVLALVGVAGAIVLIGLSGRLLLPPLPAG